MANSRRSQKNSAPKREQQKQEPQLTEEEKRQKEMEEKEQAKADLTSQYTSALANFITSNTPGQKLDIYKNEILPIEQSEYYKDLKPKFEDYIDFLETKSEDLRNELNISKVLAEIEKEGKAAPQQEQNVNNKSDNVMLQAMIEGDKTVAEYAKHVEELSKAQTLGEKMDYYVDKMRPFLETEEAKRMESTFKAVNDLIPENQKQTVLQMNEIYKKAIEMDKKEEEKEAQPKETREDRAARETAEKQKEEEKEKIAEELKALNEEWKKLQKIDLDARKSAEDLMRTYTKTAALLNQGGIENDLDAEAKKVAGQCNSFHNQVSMVKQQMDAINANLTMQKLMMARQAIQGLENQGRQLIDTNQKSANLNKAYTYNLESKGIEDNPFYPSAIRREILHISEAQKYMDIAKKNYHDATKDLDDVKHQRQVKLDQKMLMMQIMSGKVKFSDMSQKDLTTLNERPKSEFMLKITEWSAKRKMELAQKDLAQEKDRIAAAKFEIKEKMKRIEYDLNKAMEKMEKSNKTPTQRQLNKLSEFAKMQQAMEVVDRSINNSMEQVSAINQDAKNREEQQRAAEMAQQQQEQVQEQEQEQVQPEFTEQENDKENQEQEEEQEEEAELE